MGNQVPFFDQCRNERVRDPNPNPQVPLCGRACGKPCGAEALDDGFVCDPAGAFFEDTIAHLSELDQLAFRFAASANLSALRWLFLHGARPESFDSNGTTLLHAASRSGSLQIVKDLVRRGLSPDEGDRAGWTPLHVASCMGRQDVSLYLLRSGADPRTENNRGQLAEDVCSNPRTKDVVIRYDLHSNRRRAPLPPPPMPGLDGDVSGGATKVLSGLHFEPFFVPREPVLLDPRPPEVLAFVGLDLFSRSPGHGIAFLVAAGVVPDYPVNINRFLLKCQANSEQFGDFLGAEYSVSKTLCLEYLNGLPLLGTGIVEALCVAFCQTSMPRDWQRADRLSRGLAHFWWQQHTDELEARKLGQSRSAGGVAGSTAASPGGGPGGSPESSASGAGLADAGASVEVSGLELYRSLGSVEGLHGLFFSAMQLHRWLEAGHHLSLNEWMHLNTGIDGGSDLPAQVQSEAYGAVLGGGLHRPRPGLSADTGGRGGPGDRGAGRSPAASARRRSMQPMMEGWVSMLYRGRARASHDGMPAAWLVQSPRSLAAQGGVLSAGRASAATGDFGEEEISASWIDAELARKKGGPSPREDRAWAQVHGPVLLIASDPSTVPYAFVPLPASAIQSTDRAAGSLVLTGREPGASDASAGAAAGTAEAAASDWVELCLLMHDGRFQSLEAPQLELRVPLQDFDAWAACLAGATSMARCDSVRV